MAIEQLEAVHARCQLGIAGEALRQAARVRRRLAVIRMRRHEGGAGLDGRLDRSVDSLVDGDEAAQAERQRMRRQARVVVVVAQLEAGDDQQPVLLQGAGGLALDLGQIGVEARRGDAQAAPPAPCGRRGR